MTNQGKMFQAVIKKATPLHINPAKEALIGHWKDFVGDTPYQITQPEEFYFGDEKRWKMTITEKEVHA